MVDALRHRGPDGDGIRRIGPALLVHTRLAIIDVAGGDQPLESEDGAVVAIVNGEIYNHQELRRELVRARARLRHRLGLRGRRPRLRGVGPGLRAAPERHLRLRALGRPAPAAGGRARPLRRQAALLGARGRAPGAWRRRSARCWPAGSRPREVDRIALDHFLAWRFVPAPRTLLAGVSKLAGRPRCSWRRTSGVRISRYREAPGAPFEDAAVDELAAELRAQLTAPWGAR